VVLAERIRVALRPRVEAAGRAAEQALDGIGDALGRVDEARPGREPSLDEGSVPQAAVSWTRASSSGCSSHCTVRPVAVPMIAASSACGIESGPVST
jgi:hypothetical protein